MEWKVKFVKFDWVYEALISTLSFLSNMIHTRNNISIKSEFLLY